MKVNNSEIKSSSNNIKVSTTTSSRSFSNPSCSNPSCGNPKVTIKSMSHFQLPKEPRTRYLFRAPMLLQEFLNSGNLEKLKCLCYDVFTEDCLHHNLTNPPRIGRDKIYQSYESVLREAPDFYVLFYNAKRRNIRSITVCANSFGTLVPFAKEGKSQWNFFGMQTDHLDEFHKVQKQKYETLKSQNKYIVFEKKAIWYLEMNRDSSKYSKVLTKQCFLEIFEKNN